jgi:ribonucleoside-diphosphate reductase alpha chain
MLKIVNKSVPLALHGLGYSDENIDAIVNYVDKNDMIEGAPFLRDEHLAVFDCAFRPAKGKRSIQYKGHIKMMGVCQLFLSGAISKTINMPEHVTIDDIMEAYIYSWEQGLKAVAIYRENSKRSQPLNTQKTDGEVIKKKDEQKEKDIFTERKKLPQTRRSITHKFDIAGHEGYITIGLYDDGKPGELFVTISKVGSTINGLVDSWATSVSINMQYGVPIEVLFGKFRHQKFEPSGFVRNSEAGQLDSNKPIIRTASSIVDYIAQFMMNNFGSGAAKPDFGSVPILEPAIKPDQKIEEQKSLTDFGHEGLVCPHCGGPAKRIGNCAIFCTSCKQTTRSGCGE